MDYIKEMQNVKAVKQELMNRFYFRMQARYTKKKVFAAMKYRYEVARRNRRMDRALVTAKNRQRLQAIFDALRNYSHRQYLSKFSHKEESFRAELESKILVQYRSKVDSLLLYAAELEDKIKLEQDAREKMTVLYD